MISISDLDLVVVSAGDEERLLLVEPDPAHRAVVLVELVQQGAHPEEVIFDQKDITD